MGGVEDVPWITLTFWKAIKFLNKQQSSVPSLTDEDGHEAHTGSQKADMLNSLGPMADISVMVCP